jgi:hypothetical protein
VDWKVSRQSSALAPAKIAMTAARAKPNKYTNSTVNMGLRRSVVKVGCKRCVLIIFMVSVSLLPQENTAAREKLQTRQRAKS